MVARYLIDTDWIIDALHGEPTATRTLADLAIPGVAVSLVSYGELFQGAYYAYDPESALRELRTFLRGKRILPLTEQIVERFAIVRGSLTRHVQRQIGDLDLLIAATALTYHLVLVTRNLRDFQHIPDLQVYQPA